MGQCQAKLWATEQCLF